jgi:hypothetical protein
MAHSCSPSFICASLILRTEVARRHVGFGTSKEHMEAGLRLRALSRCSYRHCRGGFAAARGDLRRRRVVAASCSPTFCSRAWRELSLVSSRPSRLTSSWESLTFCALCSCCEWKWQWRSGWPRGEWRGGGAPQEDASRGASLAAGNCWLLSFHFCSQLISELGAVWFHPTKI